MLVSVGRTSRFVGLLVVALSAALCGLARGASPLPLHERIDQLLESTALGPVADLADDAEFLRRASLDLNGVIPTAAEARAFLADKSAYKRMALVDRLLASPRYARHMSTVFDVMYMERSDRGSQLRGPWQEYLRDAFGARKPYDQIVREILSADGTDGPLQGAGQFYLARDCEPHALTRDIGRFFFGMDMQCAQCHDHPLVDDYYQADYYGLYAFVARTQLFRQPKTKLQLVSEKADGEASFKSVFTGVSADKVVPRLPKGNWFADPPLVKGKEYKIKPEKNIRGIPSYSRRLELAGVVANCENPAFNRNIVNRLWTIMFGRGLVHSPDFQHPDNPPSHPELLELLAVEFRRSKYDIAGFLRELALTRAYQRSSRAPAPEGWQPSIVEARLPALAKQAAYCQAALDKAQRAADKLAEKAATQKVSDAKPAAKAETDSPARRRRNVPPNEGELARAKIAAATAKTRLDEAKKLLEYARLWKTDRAAAERVWSGLVDDWANRGYMALLKPLSAEQLAMSLLQVNDRVAAATASSVATYQRKPTDELKNASAAERPHILAELIEKRDHNIFKPTLTAFAGLYGGAPGQEFQATLNQALFVANGNVVQDLTKPSGNNLAERLAKLKQPAEVADELYLATLTRLPSADEQTEVAAYLKERAADRATAIGEMVWALLASNEFRFNH